MLTAEMIETAKKDLVTAWGDAGSNVIRICETVAPFNGTAKDFLQYCTACGGNWGGMLLTGIKELYPEVWDAIPDDMRIFAWAALCSTLILCGVDTSE